MVFVGATPKLYIITNFHKYFETLPQKQRKRFQHVKELETFILNPKKTQSLNFILMKCSNKRKV